MKNDPLSTPYRFLVGSYTSAPEHGVYLLRFDPLNEGLSLDTLIGSIKNPSFIIANDANNLIFTLEEVAGEKGGNVLSFAFDQTKAKKLGESPTFGGAPCYLSLSDDEQYLVAGNYSGGNLSLYAISSEGKLEHIQTIDHEGSGSNPTRQEAPHVHSTVFDKEGRHLIVADLGTDEIRIYDFDPDATMPLSLQSIVNTSDGDGPRHSVLSPDGKEMIVLQELTAALTVYDYQNGQLIPRQRLSLLEEGYEGAVGAAEVRYSPDGKHIYASNRGDANTLTVFARSANGSYARVQQLSSGGVNPRNFNLTSDGLYLLSANQSSNDLVVYQRDKETGFLSPTEFKISLHQPSYLFSLD
ncbi:lactonase family protein [Algoriphagus namhaensis]